ncbi:MAG: dephospho-CoA kinase [Terracoccus sp.]
MLRVGVTGGIGSGKSTVSARLRALGADVIDADQVARAVVEPGQPALARIRERFGAEVIRDDGSLDRAGLAAVVFADPAALQSLEEITGPAINAQVADRRSRVPRDRVSVFDMPLLVERGLWVHEHLSVVVEVDTETRVRRLVEGRGLGEADAGRRIAAQATDVQRRAVADVVLDNTGTPEDLERLVDELWADRLAPYDANLRSGTRTRRPDTDAVVAPRSDWAARGDRVVTRIEAALADAGGVAGVEHIGSTAVPGLLAKDVIDVQVGVRSLTDADTAEFRSGLARAGYLLSVGNERDTPHPVGAAPEQWAKRFWGGCDPGEIVHVHVRALGSGGWRFAILFRDWLRADPEALEAYAAEKRRLLALDPRTDAYVDAKEPWFDGAWHRAESWAARTSWTPPTHP